MTSAVSKRKKRNRRTAMRRKKRQEQQHIEEIDRLAEQALILQNNADTWDAVVTCHNIPDRTNKKENRATSPFAWLYPSYWFYF